MKAQRPSGGALSRILGELADSPPDQPITLARLMQALGERGHAMLVFVLVLPFLQPIPLPGVSTVFGLAVTAIGSQMLLARPPWLPRRLSNRPLPRDTFVHLAHGAQQVFRRFERLIQPRLSFMHAHPGMQRLSGLVLVLSGLLLALPLPIPVSNFLPAFSIALIGLGSIEEDGLLVGLGYFAFLVSVAFFVALVLLPTLGLEHVLR